MIGLYQGTSSLVPANSTKTGGLQPLGRELRTGITTGAKALILLVRIGTTEVVP
jgi:hypothetical protein